MFVIAVFSVCLVFHIRHHKQDCQWRGRIHHRRHSDNLSDNKMVLRYHLYICRSNYILHYVDGAVRQVLSSDLQ